MAIGEMRFDAYSTKKPKESSISACTCVSVVFKFGTVTFRPCDQRVPYLGPGRKLVAVDVSAFAL